ncbi:aminoglycoside phosphotransferase family protein [Methylacidimicrobium sp. B4]|uniref:aminoglycoside phosphotransferase family protein n=1 Tax=Methylacidimicrobium sp. B4 TaxID=2796139 RepID=UPI001A909CB4|nr:phosphotransferase [Methylacidimicrobium sp. B4]QSR84815.1 phosphotransferase [Methylacidimicrobium sp. B4]
MLLDQLLAETARRFPQYELGQTSITKLEKGGSDRSFYRIRMEPDWSLILVRYGESRPENARYGPLGNFLHSLGVRSPRIYGQDPLRGLLWIEDLGDADLWSYRNAPWQELGPLYRSALREIFALHARGDGGLGGLRTEPPFTRDLYAWEQGYFFANCLGRFLHLEASPLARLSALPRLTWIAERLAAFPRHLIHRDFQSQNVLIRAGQAYLIDFQGMRLGLASYDLASLLYDPYVALHAEQREELRSYYGSLWREASLTPPEDLGEAFDWAALQRLMQALGAYGYLGLVKKKEKFLRYIPVALRLLAEVLQRIPGLEPLLAQVELSLAALRQETRKRGREASRPA